MQGGNDAAQESARNTAALTDAIFANYTLPRRIIPNQGRSLLVQARPCRPCLAATYVLAVVNFRLLGFLVRTTRRKNENATVR
jgi:hypothetical protein